VEGETWGRTGRRLDICESVYREHWRERTKRHRADQIKRWGAMMWRFGCHKLLAARKGAFAAIVRTRRRNTFPFFAAVRAFLGELSAAEAVERLQEQEDCQKADRDVNATTHSSLMVADRLRQTDRLV
jgi:hypothetical protein